MPIEALLGDGDADSMETSDDFSNNAISFNGYDAPCHILGDDSKEVLDES